MAALFGAVLMGEGFGRVRTLAACVIFGGVIVIAGYG
jgi:drug/metabolite transporter (DMT)-like permease